jgi:integrase
MSVADKNQKRRDSKGRILRNGESQRADGRYRYKYTVDGESRDVYSWKLEPTDKVPTGKRDCVALRILEKQIKADLENGITPDGGGLTVVQLCQKYLLTKTGVTHNTEAGYQTVMNVLKASPFGTKRIDKIKQIDGKEFLIRLQQDSGKSYSSIHSIRGVLRPAFKLAVDNDYIRKNPFDFPLVDVIVDDSVRREAITRDQERSFLKFIKEDTHFSKYYDAVYILFKTGLRISEFCGLTLSDVDIKKKTIQIDHQLQRKRDGSLYIINPISKKASTKTPAGVRTIPMTDDVCTAFKRIIENRNPPKEEPMVDGYVGFLFFVSWNGRTRPSVAMDWEHRFQRILNKYNDVYKVQLPKITPHVCRHTYCSNMARAGMNPKTLQYLMGHSDISVTLDTYTHLGLEDASEELKRLEKIGVVNR